MVKENKVIIKEWRKIIGEGRYPKRNEVEKRTRKKRKKKIKKNRRKVLRLWDLMGLRV